MNRPHEILDFWFEGLNDDGLIDRKDPRVQKWFTKDPRFDFVIREKFEPDLIKASLGLYKIWEETIQGRLALVVLFDQFSRNMYRDNFMMFEYDSLALDLTVLSIHEKKDQALSLIERFFLYMPLMHSEDLRMQELSLEYFADLIEQSKAKSPQNIVYYEYTFDYAKRHFTIIERFGRFPHRNTILNRDSSLQELEFLKQPGSFF